MQPHSVRICGLFIVEAGQPEKESEKLTYSGLPCLFDLIHTVLENSQHPQALMGIWLRLQPPFVSAYFILWRSGI